LTQWVFRSTIESSFLDGETHQISPSKRGLSKKAVPLFYSTRGFPSLRHHERGNPQFSEGKNHV